VPRLTGEIGKPQCVEVQPVDPIAGAVALILEVVDHQVAGSVMIAAAPVDNKLGIIRCGGQGLDSIGNGLRRGGKDFRHLDRKSSQQG
jgi:hypothetical protein